MRAYPIEAEGLARRFGAVTAVDGVDLRITAGEVYGLLGPNGAGKSTTVRMLTTLLRPSAGRASVAGFDVVRDAPSVRARIGVALQDAAIDPLLTARELLALQAVLHAIPKRHARARAEELLVRVGLTGAANRRVATYSGGMRRRLDLALSLVHAPQVLFLDEPTTGLDPTSRTALWEEVRRLNDDGTTVLLTTQYLEEADRLADRIGIIDGGKLAVEGRPADLKADIGAPTLVVDVDAASGAQAAEILARHGEERAVALAAPTVRRLAIGLAAGAAGVAPVVRDLDDAGIVVSHLQLDAPSLDDVFAEVTGRRLEGAGPTEAEAEAAAGAPDTRDTRDTRDTPSVP